MLLGLITFEVVGDSVSDSLLLAPWLLLLVLKLAVVFTGLEPVLDVVALLEPV